MSAQHTPGPWESRKHNYGDHRDAIGIFPKGAMLNIVPCVYGRTLEQCDANTALIAAAPDMLAALEALVNSQNFRADPTIETLRARDAAIDKAFAAIAKAKGQA